jgi:hypothetical protein
MKTIAGKRMRSIFIWPLFLSLAIVAAHSSIAFGRIASRESHNQYIFMDPAAERDRIMIVLENKLEDQKLLEKAGDKLRTLSNAQIKLISSLSDRITSESNTAGADIAFLFIAALIILS